MTELTPIRKVLLATPIGKLSYPALLEPRTFERGDGTTKTSYSTNLLLPPDAKKSDAWTTITKTVMTYAVNELGAKSVVKSKAGHYEPKFKLPGVKEPDGKIEGFEDWWRFYASANENFPPKLLNKDGAEIDPDESERLIFPGADASVVFGLYFYDNPAFPAGCSFQLNAVCLFGTGEPFQFDTSPSRDDIHAAVTAAVIASGGAMNQLEDKSDEPAPIKATVVDFDDDIPF